MVKAAALSRARARTIEARPLRLEVDPSTPRYWMGGDPYKTHMLNALSFTFPPGERYFMAAVKALREHVKDPTLVEQVRGFLAQEALHSREHTALNDWLDRLGYPASAVSRAIGKDLNARQARRSAERNLAVTCALEHFTAIMAEAWLNEPEMRAQAHEAVRDLWTWHALEELDHKAVAYDVYRAAGGSYVQRVAAMAMITFGLIGSVGFLQAMLMKQDGQLTNAKSWLSGVREFWGPRGHFTKLIPSYLSYYRPDFHPWERDDSALIARFDAELRARWSGETQQEERSALQESP